MNTHEGYSKKTISNANVLLAGGGDKSLADFLSGIQYVSASKKIQYKTATDNASWQDLVTLVTTDENVKQTPKTDNANRPLMMINGGTGAGELINTSIFSTGIYANASTKMITANGFVKTNSDSSHVLLGDGGHKALSDFAMAHSHPYIPYGTSHTNDQINNTSTGGPMLYDCRGNSVVNIGQGAYYAVLDIGTYSGYHPQLAMNYQNNKDPELYIRKLGCVDTPNSTWSPWYKVLTTLNSSINGKTVTINGVSQTYAYDSSLANYVLKAGDIMTGTLTINVNTTYPLKLIGSDDYTVIHFRNQSDEHLIDFGYLGSNDMAYLANVKKYGLFTIDNTGCYYSTTASNFKLNTIWHSGNLTNLNQLINGPGYITGVNDSTLPKRLKSYTSQYNVDPDNFKESGFAYCNSGTNNPYGDANLIGVFHTNGGWGHQLAFKFSGNGTTGTGYDGKDIRTRMYSSSNKAWTNWYDICTSGNTYVSNNKGYILSTEITYVNNAGDADTLDSYHASHFLVAGNYVPYLTTSTRASVDGTNSYPVFYNLESNNLITNYLNYWYVLNMGKHSGNHSATQIAMPYENSITDTELFIRSAKGSTWRAWRRVLHDNNYTNYTVTKTGGGASGTWEINITGNAASATKLKNSRKIWGQPFDGTADVDKTLYLHRVTGPDYGKISFYSESYYTWFNYMTPTTTLYANAVSPTGVSSPAGNYVTSWALRSLIENGSGFGWTWESCTNTLNATPDIKMEISSDTGNFWVKGTAASSGFIKAGSSNSYFLLGGGGHILTSNYAPAGNYVLYETSSTIDSVNNTNNYPRMFDLENNAMLSYGSYYYILNMGKYSGGNHSAQIAMNYHNNGDDSELFIRKANGSTWTSWHRVLHDNNYTDYVKNASLTLKTAGTTLTTFYANDSTNRTFNVTCANIGAQPAGNYIQYETSTAVETINNTSTSGPYLYDDRGNNSVGGLGSYYAILDIGTYPGYHPLLAMNYQNNLNPLLYIRKQGCVATPNSTWSSWYTVLHSGNWSQYVTCASIGAQPAGEYVLRAGDTMKGGLNLNRYGATNGTGLEFYSSSYNSWQIYMHAAGSSQTAGWNKKITTVPSGTYVTSWALRQVIEGSSGFGWTWESMSSTGTSPSIVMELSSNSGNLKTIGNVYAVNFYTTSDRNKKTNISSFSEHIRKFQLKDTEKWHYGVIAQEVEEMFRDGEEGNMTVNYNSILSFYIGQLENKVKMLEERIKRLESK